MSIVFQQAPLVYSGSYLLSSERITLAEAFNSRLKSGIGDMAKRIHQYTFNLNRQIRNPSADGNFPSLGEFPLFYQMIDNDVNPTTWPLTEQGEYEGANIASPGMQFIFGVGDPDNGGTAGEGDNFTAFDAFRPTTGNSPEDYWNNAKLQRGGYDPNTTAQLAPMLEVSQRHFRLSFPDYSRHHKSPGGYLPTPQKAYKDCSSLDENGNSSYWTSYIYKFKNKSTQAIDYTGTGTCGPNYGGSESDVYTILDYPFAWYVVLYSGAVLPFRKAEYIMYNDGGGYPSREDGGQIQRLLVNPFIQDFRGTDAQRNQVCFDNPYIEYSFANQDFYTSQYQLAPNYGVENGEVIDVEYPNWLFTGNQASASIGTPSTVHTGFVRSGHLIKQRFLSHNVDIQLLQDGNVVHEFTVNKTSGSFVQTFSNGPSSGAVNYRFKTTASFSDVNGYIYLEQSELVNYKPEIWDGYALIRLGSARGAIGDEMDTRGIDCTYARSISDNYFKYGCMVNSNGAISVEQQSAAANVNPVFDAGRKYINSFVRTINGTDMQLTSRPLITGYEVSESYAGLVTSSKSILYFNRYQSAVGLVSNNIDMFVDIANMENSASNGIVTAAPIGGYTNEWLFELCGKPYDPSISSQWKPEVYANYFPYINRCHILPGYRECDKNNNVPLFRYLQDNAGSPSVDLRDELYFPESLTAYTYDGIGGNMLNKKEYEDAEDAGGVIAKNFYKSCQIYPKPYVIESVTVQAGDIVKIVLDRRLQHCDEAPNIIANNVAAWDFNTVSAEPYRTDENIVRLFLLKMLSEGNNPQSITGDHSVNSRLQDDTNDPYASIYPTFFFTKLIPKPFANDGIPTTGSVELSGSIPRPYDLTLCETYLRATCEGFVDETLSVANACETDFSTDFDYTFTNLCNDAFGGSWISTITGSVRADYPLTYGPLSDQVVNTQVFNQIASCVNKLTKARVPLPYRIEYQIKKYRDSITLTPSWPDGAAGTCNSISTKMIQFGVTLPNPTTLYETLDWANAFDGVEVTTGAEWGCDGSQNFMLHVYRDTFNIRFMPSDPLANYAMNDDLLGLVSGSVQTAAVFIRDVLTDYPITMELLPTVDPNSGCSFNENFWKDDDTGEYYNNTATPTVVSNCTYYNGNVEIDAGTLSTSDIAIGVAWPYEPCNWLPYKKRNLAVVNTRHLIVEVPTV